MRCRIGALSYAVVLFALSSAAFAGQTLYVDADAAGANNGSSWADAFNYLQDALSAAQSGDEIWVAEGIYEPDQGSSQTPGDRTATFQLINGMALYGGFPPDGGSWQDRDPNNFETILSGDLNGNDVDVNNPRDLLGEPTRAENSYHVVTSEAVDETCVLDSFTITGGYSSGSWPDSAGGGMFNDFGNPMVRNCTFTRNWADDGGGMFNWESSPMVTNCIFRGNSAGNNGGGMYNFGYPAPCNPIVTNCTFSGNSGRSYGGGMCNLADANPTLTNCIFSGNSAAYGGGMANIFWCSPTLTNCTFSGNWIDYYLGGGGIYNFWECYPTVTNCILWGNRSFDGLHYRPDEIWNEHASWTVVSYSDVQGGWGEPDSHNINADPNFVDAGYLDDNGTSYIRDDFWVEGDYRLQAGSPCIDAGTNRISGGPHETDLDGNRRVWDGDSDGVRTIDMGAYEYGSPPYVPATFHVPQDYTTIQMAIDATVRRDTVVVASGRYVENINFKGKNIVVSSTDTYDPDVVAGTIIDGGGVDRVVTFAGTEDPSCKLAGFTITGGFTSGEGGGIGGNDTLAGISKCTIKNNSAGYGGGLADCDGTIEKCIITGNSATNNGGGVVASDGTISNCLIYGNSADYGGGMNYCNGDIINCTIVYNTATIEGGGLRRCDGTVINCIVWDNSPGQLYDCNLIPTYSCWDDRPISYWKFEGDADDEMGNNHGTVYGDETLTDGISGQAYQFNDANDYIDVGNDTSLKPQLPVTLTAWIKRHESDKGRRIIELDNHQVANYGVWLRAKNGGNIGVSFGDGTGLFAPSRRSKHGTTVLELDTWYHIAGVVRSDVDMDIYINGVDDGGTYDGTGGSLAYSDGNSLIGSGSLQCTIDEVAVYDRALSAAEVQRLFDNSSGYVPEPTNTNEDPNFALEEDWHIMSGSVCIDAGDPNYIPAPDETDLDGNPRIIDGDGDGEAIVDMGAYEFVPAIEIEADLRILPRVINQKSRGRYVMAIMRLPEGIAEEDIDEDEGFVLEPGNIESILWRTAVYDEQVRVFAVFEKARLMDAVSSNGEIELTVSGQLESGQGIYGVDTIRIIGPPGEHPRGYTRSRPQRRAGRRVH